MADDHRAEELTTELLPPEVDIGELQYVLSNFYRSASIHEAAVRFPESNSGQPHAIEIRYTKVGTATIWSGPSLTPKDLIAIKELVTAVLLESPGAIVGRSILYADVPVEAWYKFRSAFGIFSVPLDAPRPTVAVGCHPAVLEVSIRDSRDWMIRGLRHRRASRRLTLLLHLLTNGRLYLPQFGRSAWFHVPGQLPSYSQESYGYYGYESWAIELADSDRSPIHRISASEYYSRLGVTGGETLDLPENIDALVGAWLSLNTVDIDRFARACFWLHHSKMVAQLSLSASYMALIQAIETLCSDEGGERCSECGKLRDGSTRRFREFLREFGPDINTKDLNELYRLRSKLSHGNLLLGSDDEEGVLGFSDPIHNDQHHSWERGTLVTRIALINWLLCSGGGQVVGARLGKKGKIGYMFLGS